MAAEGLQQQASWGWRPTSWLELQLLLVLLVQQQQRQLLLLLLLLLLFLLEGAVGFW